jgi:beta-galactosidase
MYYLFKSQWTTDPMVHLLPMNWTDHDPGDPVSVWAYANVDTVELFLNGRSLGVRRFDHKTTTYGKQYLETTEATGDDKTVTSGPYPGSYTSPNGSAGKLHLSWTVPFAPGKLVAVARKDGREVARDEVDTAGAPATVRLTPDKRAIAPDGRSLSYVTADVVDANGVLVPDADNELSFGVSGGRLAGTDNGQEESAENYKSPDRAAFNGKALAIVQSTDRPGPITVSVSSPGLAPASTTIDAGHGGHARPAARRRSRAHAHARQTATPTADASFSGAPTTLPAAMLDGNTTSGGWSNYYNKAATALLPAISKAHPSDWVSVSWPAAQSFGTVRAYFTTDAQRTLPSSIEVTYLDHGRYVPVSGLHVDWATASNQPSTITFDPVSSTSVRLKLISPFPNASNGFFQIAELQVE